MERTYQNGLTGERRTVSDPAEIDWYERAGAPWYRAETPEPLDAYPPSQRAPEPAAPAVTARPAARKPKA